MNPESSTSMEGADRHAALFSEMVMQYASMALMFMGRAPHPETGQTVKDLEGAQMFIAQLEMLEARTKGNLTPAEEALLKQSLLATRLAFVEVVEGSPAPPNQKGDGSAPPAGEAAKPAGESGAPASAAEADERKKFVKKY